MNDQMLMFIVVRLQRVVDLPGPRPIDVPCCETAVALKTKSFVLLHNTPGRISDP